MLDLRLAGNVRELENTIERAVALETGAEITRECCRSALMGISRSRRFTFPARRCGSRGRD